MDIQKHWDRWIWLIPAALIATVGLRLLLADQPFCSADPNDNCFREWVSALGGWAAVGAAIPTIFFLSKQVTDAEKFARASVLMTTLPTVEHAEHIRTLAKLLKSGSVASKELLEQIPSDDWSADAVTLAVRAHVMLKFLDRAELHAASGEFKTMYSSKVIIDMINGDIKSIEKLTADASLDRIEHARDASLRSLDMVDAFAEELSNRAETRLEIAEQLLNMR